MGRHDGVVSAWAEQASEAPLVWQLSEHVTAPPSGRAAEPSPNTATFPGYEILRALGYGGMVEPCVWLAEPTS